MGEPGPLGQQLRRLRRERGLSQAELAEMADVSSDLVAKLEQGARMTARLTSLTKLARALDVEMSELIGRRPRLDRTADETSLLAVRDVLLDPEALPGLDRTDDLGEPTPLQQLGEALNIAWAHYWAGRFGLLAVMLPGLIGEARASFARAGADVSAVLAQAYQLAGCLNVHMGAEDLAAIGAERAIAVAAQGSDQLQWASVSGTYSWVLLAQGRYDLAERHATRMAQLIEPSLSSATPEHLTVWGALVLAAVAPAAAAGRAENVSDIVTLARAGAALMEHDRHDYQTDFGPTQVAVQATHGYAVLGHSGRALGAAREVRREGLRSIAWGRFLIDVAQAQVDAGRDDSAITTLQHSRDVSEEWFRHQPPARAMIGDLVERRRHVTPALRDIARSLELY